MFCIRADANPQIGTGHIMRCLSLADALRENGENIKFVVAEPYLQLLIEGRGFSCTVLGTSYDQMEEELPLFLPILQQDRPELIILDSYFVTPKYMKTIKSMAPLLYIDDLDLFNYPADIVVNYNIYGLETTYPQNKTYFLGPQYVPLRKEFQGLEKRIIKEGVEDVLISTGGTDLYHVALRCAEYLQIYPPNENIVFHFVLGAMNQDVAELEQIAEKCPFIKLHRQVTDMSSLMLRCDVAISAAGSTLYELCACGLPTVTYILADNQIPGARAFQKLGLMPYAGDIRYDSDFIISVFSLLQRLSSDWKARCRVSDSMQELVDGDGAKRLGMSIVYILNE